MVMLGLSLLGAAQAAKPPERVSVGTPVRIVAVSKDDAFWPNRTALEGLRCEVTAPGLERSRKSLYGGPMVCADGESYYFYQVRVEILPAEAGPTVVTATVPAASPAPAGGAAPGSAPALAPTAAPPAAEGLPANKDERMRLALRDLRNSETAATPWPVGRAAILRSVSADDAYHAELETLRGQRCVVQDEALESTGQGWWSGAMLCDGVERYFFQASLDAAPQAVAAPEWAAGTLVKVAGLEAQDVHAADAAKLVGRTCSVIVAPLVSSGEDTFAGRLFCDDGKQWQLFRVKVARP
jgi:hypothetical protein